MLASYNWLCELAGFSPDPKELAEKLTFSGLEVDDIQQLGQGFDDIVVAEIKSKTVHPTRDKLSCVTVDSGSEIVDVVCGAANCPGPGGRVVLAKVGATVGEITIQPRELAKAPSHGMLCSEVELGIGEDDEGIIILDESIDAPVGTPIVDALSLKDWIYELGVTPNRPDALYHRGLAKEIALLYDRPWQEPANNCTEALAKSVDDFVNIELLSRNACPRYAGAVVSGITVGQSPFGVKYRLHCLGIRPISNIVDVTNLILLEYGQPLHAFDLAKIAEQKIIIRDARPGEKMKTLDEVERTFDEQDLLICDANGPVAVAGVMGGLDTSVSETTKDILIESAYFNPSSIRRTSKKLKLSSESSYRFERGIDPSNTVNVLENTLEKMISLAGGQKAAGVIDLYPEPIKPVSTRVRPKRFEQIMGFSVETLEMVKILKGIGASTTVKGDEILVQVPTSRPDIEREIDLIEEISRIVGLDKIPTVLPRLQSAIPEREEYEATRQCKELLVSLGLDESITYSFVPKDQLLNLGFSQTSIVEMSNPLNVERASMRTTLLVGLLENLKRATTRYEPVVTQFEVARTFHNEGNELPKEVLNAAGVLSGPRNGWVGETADNFNVYDAKGIVGEFISALCGVQPVFTPVESVPFLHPKRGLRVSIGGDDVGVVGELHPSILTSMKLPIGASVFELDVMALYKSKQISFVKPLIEYPPMVRDVAVLVDESQDVGPIEVALQKACGHLATNVHVFDVYRGKGIEKGKKSVALSVMYRSIEKTLTDKEVDKLHGGAIKAIQKEFDLKVR